MLSAILCSALLLAADEAETLDEGPPEPLVPFYVPRAASLGFFYAIDREQITPHFRLQWEGMVVDQPHNALGWFINFGSGSIHVPAHYGVYAGVKAAIQSISRAAALEWAHDKIRVNTVLPMAASPAADLDFAQAEGRADAVVQAIPLGRMGDPATDIGQPIAFLASEESKFITGSTFSLDGGLSYLR